MYFVSKSICNLLFLPLSRYNIGTDSPLYPPIFSKIFIQWFLKGNSESQLLGFSALVIYIIFNLKKKHLTVPTTKDSMKACIELLGFRTSNTVNHHCSNPTDCGSLHKLQTTLEQLFRAISSGRVRPQTHIRDTSQVCVGVFIYIEVHTSGILSSKLLGQPI